MGSNQSLYHLHARMHPRTHMCTHAHTCMHTHTHTHTDHSVTLKGLGWIATIGLVPQQCVCVCMWCELVPRSLQCCLSSLVGRPSTCSWWSPVQTLLQVAKILFLLHALIKLIRILWVSMCAFYKYLYKCKPVVHLSMSLPQCDTHMETQIILISLSHAAEKEFCHLEQGLNRDHQLHVGQMVYQLNYWSWGSTAGCVGQAHTTCTHIQSVEVLGLW